MCILWVESKQTSKQKETVGPSLSSIMEHVCLTENWPFIGFNEQFN